MSQSQESYEKFVQEFPSTELLCELFGVASYDELFEQHYKEAVRLIGRGEVLAVYLSDVSISDAFESGELTSRKGKGKREILELNKDLYRKSHDLFKMVRERFHSMFIQAPMMHVRHQDDKPGWNGTPQPVYIFKDGAYGDAVFAYEQAIDPADDALRGKLCRELIAALTKYPMYTDLWWEYKIENDSVWLRPKELTEELKALMQKRYDEERAKSLFVMLPFYPGWEPDKSKDPLDNWERAARIIHS